MANRNTSLDFLRFIAIILVLFRHLTISGNGLVDRAGRFLSVGGWIGVDLFFVLSGFLVSGLIFKEYETYGTFRPGKFLIRRGFKIYPAFYFFLAITWGLTYYYHYASHASNMKYLSEALFYCNYLSTPPIHTWLWSICVEEHFYILLSILLYFLIRSGRLSFNAIITVYSIFLVVGLIGRLYDLHYPEYDFFRDLSRSHLRFDSLFFGVVLSYAYRKKGLTQWNSPLLTAVAVAIVSLAFICNVEDSRFRVFDTVFLVAINPFCFGYLMIRMLQVKAGWMRPFAYIGKYSYSIYLFHGFINSIVAAHFSGYKYYIIYFAGSLIIGIVVSKVIEYPFLAIRDKWFPSADPVSGALLSPVSVPSRQDSKIPRR